jgi:hypothetical protein
MAAGEDDLSVTLDSTTLDLPSVGRFRRLARVGISSAMGGGEAITAELSAAVVDGSLSAVDSHLTGGV